MKRFDLDNIIKELENFDKQENFERNIELFLIDVKKYENRIYKQEGDDNTKKYYLIH